MNRILPQDVAATVVSVVIVIGIVALALLGKEIPPELSTAEGISLTWVFVRSAQQAEAVRADIAQERLTVNGGQRNEHP